MCESQLTFSPGRGDILGEVHTVEGSHAEASSTLTKPLGRFPDPSNGEMGTLLEGLVVVGGAKKQKRGEVLQRQGMYARASQGF